jgi:hypothetical protein
MVATAEKWPKEFRINDRLKARIGYRDSRFEVEYDTKILFVGWYTLAMDPTDLPLVDRVFEAQEQWVKLSAQKKGRAVTELPISAKVTARIGFEDRHVEIVVKVVGLGYTITLQEAEAPVVRAVLAEARRWSNLPESERQKGAK